MKYLSEKDIDNVTRNWNEIADVIQSATKLIGAKDYVQPVKPYLRYKALKNRIIAMPAYLGGEYNISGIKWIASFPDNIKKNIPRANSVIVLNDADTGVPVSIINTSKISAVRTAGVTGAFVRKYMNDIKNPDTLNFGIIGFGPIGKMHMEMLFDLFDDRIEKVYLYDLSPISGNDIPDIWRSRVEILNSWEEVYLNSGVFITCTVSKERYINLPPPKGSLQLNISLRDYQPFILDHVDIIVVDDWEEICRENTDIEVMSIEKGLTEKDVLTIYEFLDFDKEIKQDDVIMFNPMGMAVYDMAMAKYYLELSNKYNHGVVL